MEKKGRPLHRRRPWRAGSCPSPAGDEQRALGQAAAERWKLLRVLQEIDDLLELLLRLVAARHVGERDLGRVARQQFALDLPKAKARFRPAASGEHEDHEAEHEEIRQERQQHDANDCPIRALTRTYTLGAERRDPLAAGLRTATAR